MVFQLHKTFFLPSTSYFFFIYVVELACHSWYSLSNFYETGIVLTFCNKNFYIKN